MYYTSTTLLFILILTFLLSFLLFFFFFNDPATTEIYTLSLHDALPISPRDIQCISPPTRTGTVRIRRRWAPDRKSTRLNSSHQIISYAVFCLKKKKKTKKKYATTKSRLSCK